MNRLTTRRRPALLIPILCAAAACSDIVEGGGAVVGGLSIRDAGGGELVSVSSTGVTGTLSVNQGAERDLDIVFRSASGAAVELGFAQSVRVTVVNSQVADWVETGETSGTLVGRARGNTTLRVDVISAGAVDYASPPIPVRVD